MYHYYLHLNMINVVNGKIKNESIKNDKIKNDKINDKIEYI